MYKAIKSSVSSKIDIVLECIALVLITGLLGFTVGCLPWYVGAVVLAEISDIEIPLWSILVFVIVPATELSIYFKTDLVDAETFLVVDFIFLALWIASLAIIGCIENKLKLGLSGTEAFVISLGMPVAFVMIITVIAFTVIGVSKIAKGHKDR